MKAQTLFSRFAQLAEQFQNCVRSNNSDWQSKSKALAAELCANYMPSGSGIDSGTQFDIAQSNSRKLVFQTSFHHMNKNGFYDGWTVHTITLRACMAHGFAMAISGRDKNQIKDYLHEVYSSALGDEVWSLAEQYKRKLEKCPEIKIVSNWTAGGSIQVWTIPALAEEKFNSFSSALEYLNQAGKLENF